MAYIKLSRTALQNNLDQIVKKAGSKEKVAAVLKDNAYGHGLEQMAREISRYGIKRAVVRSRQEALAIADFFPYILILADRPKHDGFYYAINDFEQLKTLEPGTKVELKIDTGMHRNGLQMGKIAAAIEMIKEKKAHLRGVFTHFRNADELGSELFWQNEVWKEVKRRVLTLVVRDRLPRPHFHSANSATLFRLGCEDDFARVGLAMYGYLEMDEVFDYPVLQPVLSLWARKIATRTLQPGERVGYGGEFEAKEHMLISTYDVGYGDGIFRNAKRCDAGEILGRVSMDSIVLQKDEDEICVFENAKEFAHRLETISYEVLVKLASHLDRVLV